MKLTPKYPIDLDALKKGDYISPEEISKIYSVPLTSSKFNLYALKLKCFIKEKSSQAEFQFLTKIEGGGVRILTDKESIRYTDNLSDNTVRRLFRHLQDMMRIPVAQLGHEDRDLLDKSILKNSRRVHVIKKTDKETKAIPSIGRDTPSMLNGEISKKSETNEINAPKQ
jgi:hypothetical protein